MEEMSRSRDERTSMAFSEATVTESDELSPRPVLRASTQEQCSFEAQVPELQRALAELQGVKDRLAMAVEEAKRRGTRQDRAEVFPMTARASPPMEKIFPMTARASPPASEGEDAEEQRSLSLSISSSASAPRRSSDGWMVWMDGLDSCGQKLRVASERPSSSVLSTSTSSSSPSASIGHLSVPQVPQRAQRAFFEVWRDSPATYREDGAGDERTTPFFACTPSSPGCPPEEPSGICQQDASSPRSPGVARLDPEVFGVVPSFSSGSPKTADNLDRSFDDLDRSFEEGIGIERGSCLADTPRPRPKRKFRQMPKALHRFKESGRKVLGLEEFKSSCKLSDDDDDESPRLVPLLPLRQKLGPTAADTCQPGGVR